VPYLLLRNKLTTVSETILKAPLAEAQSPLGKPKIRSMERRYLPIAARNSVNKKLSCRRETALRDRAMLRVVEYFAVTQCQSRSFEMAILSMS